MMRACLMLTGCLLLTPALCAHAADREDPEKYASLSKALQQAVAAKAPREIEDRSLGWGKTIPIPPVLRLPRLRTYVKVGDHEELPHGAWIRSRIQMNDPAKDIQVRVKSLELVEPGKASLEIEARVTARLQRQQQQWQKGLLLLDVTSDADIVLDAHIDCTATFGLNARVLPPRLEVKAEVTKVRLDLRDFKLNRIAPFVSGERAREIGEEMKGVVAALIRAYEPDVRDQANAAINKALKDGNSPLSGMNLFNLSPAKKGE